MKTNGNTILITGGSAGIGFELAKQFSALGNKVLITGRNEERLKQAASKLENVIPIAGDVTDSESTDQLLEKIREKMHMPFQKQAGKCGQIICQLWI